MRLAVKNLGGREQDVSIEIDSKGRRFGEITLQGSQDELIEALRELAKEIQTHLGRSSERNRNIGYSELHNLYDDLSALEGEPVYLSDGMYLDADGRLFE